MMFQDLAMLSPGSLTVAVQTKLALTSKATDLEETNLNSDYPNHLEAVKVGEICGASISAKSSIACLMKACIALGAQIIRAELRGLLQYIYRGTIRECDK